MTNPAPDLTEALTRITDRIPVSYGRWIRCGAGWHQLILDLDTAISELAPDYIVLQAKEKFGALRYYIDLPNIEPRCCQDFVAAHPNPYPGTGPFTAQQAAARDSWLDAVIEHGDSAAHHACIDGPEQQEALNRREETLHRIEALVAQAEEDSTGICERCGAPGRLRERGGWLTTACDPCTNGVS